MLKTRSDNKTTAIALALACGALLLQACGGGGGGGGQDGGGSADSRQTSSPAELPYTGQQPPAAFTATSEVGIALQKGLYATSYGIGTINGEPDASIWRTDLGSNDHDRQKIERAVYAGKTSEGNDVFADVMRDFALELPSASALFGSRYSASTGYSNIRGQFDDRSSELVVGTNESDGNSFKFMPRTTWGLSISQTDLSGTPVRDFLLSNVSLTKPYSELPISESFPPGSLGARFSYMAKADTFMYPNSEPFIYKEEEFIRAGWCSRQPEAGKTTLLGWFNESDGRISIYEFPSGVKCSRDNAAPNLLIGTGAWARKAGPAFNYWQMDFPASVPYSRVNPTFSQAEYDAGIRAVFIETSGGGRWSSGFLVPAGVSFKAYNLALNKTAADAIKKALNLQ